MRRPFGNAWQIIPGGAVLLVLAVLATAGGAVAFTVAPRLFTGQSMTTFEVRLPKAAGMMLEAPKSEERLDAETERLIAALEREVSEWPATPRPQPSRP